MRYCAFVLMGTAALAQTTATIVGAITDSSGAIVPKTKVIAVHTATGLTRAAETNQSGNYVLPLLPVGEYGITAEIANSAPSSMLSTNDTATRAPSGQRTPGYSVA